VIPNIGDEEARQRGMEKLVVDILGWIGALSYLMGYYLVSNRKLAGDSLAYPLMNGRGAPHRECALLSCAAIRWGQWGMDRDIHRDAEPAEGERKGEWKREKGRGRGNGKGRRGESMKPWHSQPGCG